MGKLAYGCRQRQSGNLQHAVDWQIKVTRGAIQLMQTRQTTTEMSETRLLLVSILLTITVSTIWRATFGNGVLMNTKAITTEIPRTGIQLQAQPVSKT